MRYAAYLTVLLAACTQTQRYWERPGATSQDFHTERAQCQAHAGAAPTLQQIAIAFNACMRAKGWQLVAR